jgi:aromatic-amino-acid transaminase
MPTSALEYFEPYKDVSLNPIQKSQNAFKASDLPEFPEAAPEECKHSVAQGLLLNNQAHEDYKDMQGAHINTEPGKLFQMASVKKAMDLAYKEDVGDPNSQAYRAGNDTVLQELEPMTREILFGENSELAKPNSRVATIIQRGMAPSFTFIMELLRQQHPELDTVVLGTNGYGGYMGTLQKLFEITEKYTHSTPEGNEFNFDSLSATVKGLQDPSKAVLLLQAAAYNYTGVNPTSEQKRQIVELIKETGIIPLIDSAYQGLTRGIDEDTELIRLLGETDVPFVVTDSYSKKTPLYVQRLSFAHFATGNPDQAKTLRDNAFALIRTNILSPHPSYRILHDLLKDPALRKQWLETDIPTARAILHDTKHRMAQVLGSGFEYVDPNNTQGMFNKFNISHDGVAALAERHNIFAVPAKDEDRLTPEGQPSQAARVNMGSIPIDCIPYIASSIRKIYEEFRSD